jgi:hypothetical protein
MVCNALPLLPDGYIAGLGFSETSTDPADTKALTGYIAAYPKSANDPKTPASAFDAGHVLVVKLERADGKLKAVSGELRPRDRKVSGEIERVISAAHDESEYDKLHTDLLAKAKSLPAGTMPCDIHGWSEDKDPKGLNVRAAPDVKSKVLGTLPALQVQGERRRENTPEGGWLTEFSIVGYKDGWFLIEARSRRARTMRASPIRATRRNPIPGAAGCRRTRSARNMPMAIRGWAAFIRRRTAMRTGCLRKPKAAVRSAPTAAKEDSRLQRLLGAGGKPRQGARMVAQAVLQSGDELQLTALPPLGPLSEPFS